MTDTQTTFTQLTVPQGSFDLLRYPFRTDEKLRAWDAADEYLLEFLGAKLDAISSSKILIMNDGFGTLSVALNAFTPVNFSDSLVSQISARKNLAANGIDDKQVTFLESTAALAGEFDFVLIKVPKTLALLEDQLSRIQANITEKTQIIAAGMVKNLPKKVWKILEKYLGPTTTSLAKKKARMIFATVDKQQKVPPCPYPVLYQLENTEYQICNHANVFSRDSLDIGTRFLLENLPETSAAKDIVDLGCGNGVVGLLLSERFPEAKIHFVDESFMAIDSAKETFKLYLGQKEAGKLLFEGQHQATYHVSDALDDFDKDSADLIVCNPPFHQQHATADKVAMNMFYQSRKVLKTSGELWVIGNRHLNYKHQLKKLFGNVTVVAANTKFVICKASI